MEKTIFQKIIDREIPADIVYEDDKVIAFMDVHPVSKGHLLLITKIPYPWMQDVPDETLGYTFVKAKVLMDGMKKALECDYVQLSVVGKDVPHFHIHLMPRFLNDSLHGWPTVQYEESEKGVYAEKIKSSL